MQVTGLQLTNFRNYKELKLVFDSDINVFYGENAQGKTNILEAVYLCSCLRSHRTSKDTEMISHGEKEYQVRVQYRENEKKEQKNDDKKSEEYAPFIESIDVSYYEAVAGDAERVRNKRIIRHNGIILPKMADMMGLFHAVIFAPEDLMMIKEGPANRRRYVDMLISQIRASYFSELGIYNRILMQRNTLLKQIRESRSQRDYEQMAVWDQALAESASKIIAARFDFSKKIGEIAAKYHSAITSGKEEIYVKYKTISGIAIDNSIHEIRSIFSEKLKTIFNEDIERGSTLYGPHRDDLEISLDGEGIRPFASQGQQRTAVLSLKIAELEIIKMETGDMPILLLDDVMSELDEGRRKMLLASIGEAQVLLTCTDKSHIAKEFIKETPNRTVSYYNVRHGEVLACRK